MTNTDNKKFEDDENRFIGQLKKRDNASYTLLYNKYCTSLFNLAYRITGSISESEDIIQETFKRVYTSIDQFNGKSKLFTWIYSICLNLCFRCQQNKRHLTFESIEGLIIESTGWDYRKDQYTEDKWHHYTEKVKDGCLIALVRCLPFSQRAAFILHILLKLPLSSVSGILNKSNGSIRVLICRGRQKIKKFLCSNCSFFKQSNRCNCMNFVDYSLQNGLIEKFNEKNTPVRRFLQPHLVQQEIDELKKLTLLYDSLMSETPSPGAIAIIRKAIKNDTKVTLKSKKV